MSGSFYTIDSELFIRHATLFCATESPPLENERHHDKNKAMNILLKSFNYERSELLLLFQRSISNFSQWESRFWWFSTKNDKTFESQFTIRNSRPPGICNSPLEVHLDAGTWPHIDQIETWFCLWKMVKWSPHSGMMDRAPNLSNPFAQRSVCMFRFKSHSYL